LDSRISFDKNNVTDQVFFTSPIADYSTCKYQAKLEDGRYSLLFTTYTRDEILYNSSPGEVHTWTEGSSEKLEYGTAAEIKKALGNIESQW
jgi:hypothetical protein